MGDISSSVDQTMRKLKTSNPKRDFNNKNFTMSELIHQYEKLDRTITEGMLAAEKTCYRPKQDTHGPSN
eukprot:4120435-Ditylum_brightwellii.AAC.1